MRTSLNEIRKIEEYLQKQLPDGETLVFEAQLIVNTELREKYHLQQKVHEYIKLYGRQKLRNEIELIHQEVFKTNKSFRNKILSYFKKS